MRSRLRKPIQVFLTVRVLASIAAILGRASFPAQRVISQQGYVKPAYGKLFELLVGVWERADGIWYLGIAQNGYRLDPAAHAFFPLYPALIRVLHFVLPGPPIVAALLISNAAFFAALVFIQELARPEIGDQATERALWYLALFPGSVFFLAPYTEALFLCLSAASLCAARKRRWGWAVVLGCLLGATRNLGVAILAPLALEFWGQRHAGEPRPHWTTAGLFAAVPLGLLAWFAYCEKTTGDALISIHQQVQWQRQSMLPWRTLGGGLAQAWTYCLGYPGGSYLLEAVSVAGAVFLGALAVIQRKLSSPLALWIWILILPPLMAPYPGNLLMSCYRFVAVIFPLFLALGGRVRNRAADHALRACFAATYGIAVAMYVCNQYLY